MTVVESLAELFAGPSSVIVDTEAVLVTEGTAAAVGLTMTVMLGAAVIAASPAGRAQGAVWGTIPHVQPDPLGPLADAGVRPAGSVSVTVVAPMVGPAPRFATDSV